MPVRFDVGRRGPGGSTGVEGVELEEGVLDQKVRGRVAAAVACGHAAPFLVERERDGWLLVEWPLVGRAQ